MKSKINDTTPKNPLEDKKWQKKFQEAFERHVKRGKKRKVSSVPVLRDIVCTSEDIGEPNYSLWKKTRAEWKKQKK